MWWVVIIIIATVVTLMACLRVAKESDERLYKQLHKPEKEGRIELLFSCAHIVVQVEIHSLKQLLQNQGYSEEVLETLDKDAVTIHSRIDSDKMLANINTIEANFYFQYEEEYQNMLKGLVGCLAEIDGNELIEKINADWIQLHDDYISGCTKHES